MYVFGGANAHGQGTEQLRAFSLQDEQWIYVRQSDENEYAAGPRIGHTAVGTARHMHVFGGSICGSACVHPDRIAWYDYEAGT